MDAPEIDEDKILLFTTKTCPNCRAAKTFLTEAGIPFEVIDAEEQQDLSIAYGIMQAPTLVVISGGKHETYANLSNIRKFIAESAAKA